MRIKSLLFPELLAVLLLITFGFHAAWGAVFYVDPINGSASGDGSPEKPWRTLQEVFQNNLFETQEYRSKPYLPGAPMMVKNAGAPVQPGDTLLLRTGFHGEIWYRGAFNLKAIVIAAEKGHRPTLTRITLSAVSNWILDDLTINPETAAAPGSGALLSIESHSTQGASFDVTIRNCHISSATDVGSWSKTDWNDKSFNAIAVVGDRMMIQDNICKNVDHGIYMNGNSSVVRGNLIENFAGDGMRGLGNDLLFEYNTVKNCYDVNDNHDDGFQSWSINDDPPRERVTLRGNTIINYEDPEQPFRGTLQGIGCFDGFYIDWVIENNLVVTDHWHGITLMGARGCRIVNNTVVDQNNQSPGPPWIQISPHKDGTPSSNCLIRNNLTTDLDAGEGVKSDHNMIVSSYALFFVDASNFDFHLNKNSPAVDAGTTTSAPTIDMEGTARPQGNGVDLGAYEYDPTNGGGAQSGKAEWNYRLYPNYPNPFNPKTTIRYSVEKTGKVVLQIFDLLGKEINVLVDRDSPPGEYEVEWIPAGLSSGVYLYRLRAGDFDTAKKLLYLK